MNGPSDDPMRRINVQRLKQARKEKQPKSLTQEGLVAAVAMLGVTKGYALRSYQEIERTGRCRESILVTIANVLDVRFEELLVQGEEPWWIPSREWDPELDPPGTLLLAEMGVVPFQFRTEELKALKSWCNGKASLGIRLYVGKGGMGKTRLALKLCHDMQAEDWRGGFVDSHMIRFNDEEWEKILREPEPLLLVFDYAENRQKELGWIFGRIVKRKPSRVRVLLLARAVGDWWQHLKSERVVGDLISGPATSTPLPLSSLTLTVRERQQSYRAAAEAFATKLKKAIPDLPNRDFQEQYYESVLLLHMDALAAVEGQKVKGEDGILDYVLNREQRFWTTGLDTRGLGKTLLDGVWQAMAAVTFGRGLATQEHGFALLRDLPFFQGQTPDVLNAINDLLHECYPGDRGHWIEPVQPDLLGERLLERAFQAEPLRKAVFAAVRKAAKKLGMTHARR